MRVDLRVQDRAPGARCVLCHDDLEGPVSSCPGCAAAWHLECSLESGRTRCPTIGCAGGGPLHEARPPGARAAEALVGARATDSAEERALVAASSARRSPWSAVAARLKGAWRGVSVALVVAGCPAVCAGAALLAFGLLLHESLGVRPAAVLLPIVAVGALGGFAYAVRVLSREGVRVRDQALVLAAAIAAATAAGGLVPRWDLELAIAVGYLIGAALAGAWVLRRRDGDAGRG